MRLIYFFSSSSSFLCPEAVYDHCSAEGGEEEITPLSARSRSSRGERRDGITVLHENALSCLLAECCEREEDEEEGEEAGGEEEGSAGSLAEGER